MKTIGQILRRRAGTVVKVGPADTVRHALELMTQHDVGAALVMEDAALLGILTELDYARKVVLKGKDPAATRVAEVMTERVYCATPYMTMDEAIARASDRNVRHLPVMDARSAVVGLISTRELIREQLAEQRLGAELAGQYEAA